MATRERAERVMMPVDELYVTYICDVCGKREEIRDDFVHVPPLGWISITDFGEAGMKYDICSWRCLSRLGLRRTSP